MKGLHSRLFFLHQTTSSAFSLIIPNKCSKTKIIIIIILLIFLCAALIVLQYTFRLEAFVVNFKTVELMVYSFALTVLWKDSQSTNPGTYALLLYAVPYSLAVIVSSLEHYPIHTSVFNEKDYSNEMRQQMMSSKKKGKKFIILLI